ncbi:hypothetical protein ACIRJR_12465 [Streptomyces sp. NPDC102402]|uniref:hypothetical protein n=1 Tax=Streptomyces sp. NPDC102402 TaxID=3366169 RepID=UPI003818B75B
MGGSGRADTQTEDAAPGSRPRPRRRLLRRLGVVALVLAVPVGGLVWLFQDDLFHPFGDARACEGSDAPLSDFPGVGNAPLPDDASDVHYFTQDGTAQVSFRSSRIPEFLHRSGLLAEGAPPFDKQDGGAYGLGDGEPDRPQGLCGPALRGPAWMYGGTFVSVLVERSDINPDAFRGPAARAVVTYRSP